MSESAGAVKTPRARRIYRASRIKRHRRTKAELAALRESIYTVLETIQPATLRQLYYQLVFRHIIEKTEAEYDAVGRNLLFLRREGEVPYPWVADNTRWQRKPKTFCSVEDALANVARTYRRNLWDDLDVYVEVWCEKDALAGVLWDVTGRWDVPLMVTRGFSSESYLYEAAQSIKAQGKPAYLYYFGDRDPSGVSIDRTVESRLSDMAPEADITFERVAVTPEQIVELHLPSRPTKSTDSRAKNFVGDSYELDSIEPGTLRQMVRDCIERHVDQDHLERMATVEEAERKTLLDVVERMRTGRAEE